MKVSHAGTSNLDRVHVRNDPAARDAGIARSEQQVQAMHRAIEEVKAIYTELKLPDAEVAMKLAALRGDGGGGGGGAGGSDSSVGAVLAAVEEEILLAKARVGVRDAMKMMMGRLPKLWKKLGVDGEMALQRLALAVTHPIDVKLNVDAEVGTH